ncbi:hypothetical protein MUK42_00762 [Musa troglodytarum]|uniref:Uncharacterized protein n=1 Tax=Musa troglodytarum TaxID=320322 RepID=A0A9E7FS82_9LILI|nr:hypothetical protein MUK42_00762 [Musa troglodytarum]
MQVRRKKRTKMRLLSLFSHAARRSGSSSWDLALTARERQRAAAAAKRFLRAKESGMSAWRKEIHTPPPANSSDRPTAPQLFLRRGWKGRKRSGKDRRFMRTVFESDLGRMEAMHLAHRMRQHRSLTIVNPDRFRLRRATPGSTVRAGRGGRRFFGPRVEAVLSWKFSAADSDRRGSVAIMGSAGPATGTASARPSPARPFRYRGEDVVPLVWYRGFHTSRKKGVPPWKKAAFPLPSTLHPHPRVPVFLLPRPNQNKRRSPECRGVDGDALPSDAPCREILPVHADPAALLTVSVVLLMLPARGVFSLPVDSNGRTKSDRLLRWSIYEAKDGMKGKRRPVGGGALVGTQGIQISQFPGGCHSSPSFLHG